MTRDLDVAVAVVRAAGPILLAKHGRVTVDFKSAPTDVVTEADREAEAASVAVLRELRPDDGILGEEGTSVDGDRQWTVDALDGTLNYTLGIPFWCTAVSLTGADGERLASAILDPARDELFCAARGEGAWCNGEPLRVAGPDALNEAVLSTYVHPEPPPPEMAKLLDATGTVRALGSGSLELSWVAAGRLHAWGQYDALPWDWRPGALLVAEAGGASIERGRWSIAARPALASAIADVVAP
ncbi:MAG TPA: inositol monophosphatase family protein [Solirubrobacteraceae bacterium]|nr:inositol monophosphatase family protein [Solirubrobacteraceae bacterium]